MHSSSLRGSEFEMTVDGRATAHADFFRGFAKTRRLGLVASDRADGIGAACLLMAYVTAFYDDYRADGGQFKAYPDFFAFQRAEPMACYGMLDIWPDHKLVHVGQDPEEKLQAINDRGVNVLVLPDSEPSHRAYEQISLSGARRNIDHCYLYAFDGQVDGADVTIGCARSPIGDWVIDTFNTLKDDPGIRQQRDEWLGLQADSDRLVQTFRRVELDDALARL
ncbi:MAG: hypothetical protein CMJ18_17680 [Phycisphaeraceae bacterium]|nr:hypothetical protein [Phycisphaeraceae bacterium]